VVEAEILGVVYVVAVDNTVVLVVDVNHATVAPAEGIAVN
jgi:hypothetical protein